MCGIFGIWHLDGKPIDLQAVRAATTMLRHRGPDDEGYLLVSNPAKRIVSCGGPDTDPSLNVPAIHTLSNEAFDLAFGFRRLAILDLSSAGHQPMASADGRFWIVFNGEIYNYVELRQELGPKGYHFHTGTDTEVILCAYAEWGDACLERFNGMWAFALWDHREQRLLIARDRFGVKPLYYTSDHTRFAFASEIKALVGQHGVQFEPEDEAIYRYLTHGTLPSPPAGQTFFKGVQSLPPGHWMTVQHHTTVKRRYWALSALTRPAQVTDVVEQYRDLFTDSVRLRLRADVPIGTCLSGGVDSSSIVCMVNRLMLQGGVPVEQIGQRQKTFSAVYDTIGPYNEREHIVRVLQATNAEGNFVFPTLERLRTEVERLVWHQDEPFQSTSIFAQWCVMSKVRERGVTVLLDGQGADETLGGYRPFPILLGDLIRQAQYTRALAEARAIQDETGLPAAPLLLRALARQLPQAWTQELRQRRWARQADVSALQPDFASSQETNTANQVLSWPDLTSNLIDLVQESSIPHLLRYEDRNSMAFGIEARVPYLDYRLVRFAFEQAADWRIHQGWTKWVLRKAMDGIAPREIVWRRDKVGFETPEVAWLREWLGLEPDLWGNCALRKYLNREAVLKRIALWMTRGGDARPIWRWINLGIWLQIWRQPSPRSATLLSGV